MFNRNYANITSSTCWALFILASTSSCLCIASQIVVLCVLHLDLLSFIFQFSLVKLISQSFTVQCTVLYLHTECSTRFGLDLIEQLLQPTLLQQLNRLLNFFWFYQDTQQSVFARWNHAKVVTIYFLVRVSKYLDETKLFQLHSIHFQLLDFPNLLLLQVYLC